MLLPEYHSPDYFQASYIDGDVTVHPTVVMAAGVIIQAAPQTMINIGAGVCIGRGVVINAWQGNINIGKEVVIGAGVLIFGSSQIGEKVCIGANTTIFDQDIVANTVISPATILGDRSRQVILVSVNETDEGIDPPSNFQPELTVNPLQQINQQIHQQINTGSTFSAVNPIESEPLSEPLKNSSDYLANWTEPELESESEPMIETDYPIISEITPEPIPELTPEQLEIEEESFSTFNPDKPINPLQNFNLSQISLDNSEQTLAINTPTSQGINTELQSNTNSYITPNINNPNINTAPTQFQVDSEEETNQLNPENESTSLITQPDQTQANPDNNSPAPAPSHQTSQNTKNRVAGQEYLQEVMKTLFPYKNSLTNPPE